MEDISLKRREIEAKLDEEKGSIQWLKDSLQRSDQLANNMVNILTSFEERLCKLEDTILPVHKETTDLQRRQENVNKTLNLLDEVLSYHNVASNLKPIIEEGPTGRLSEYLLQMEKIDEAIAFFEKNNPDSIEKSVLLSLNESARDSLVREFSMLLKRNSKPVPAVTIRDLLNAMAENSAMEGATKLHDPTFQHLSLQSRDPSDPKHSNAVSELDAEDSQIEHFSEKVMDELGTIASWLTKHKKGTDFMNLYFQYRSTMLLQSLENVKKEGVSFNYEVIVGRKKPPLKRQVADVLKKKLGPRKSTKQVIETLYGHKRTPSNYEPPMDEDANSEVSIFITCTAALLKLMQSERQLMQSVIPEERQIPIFSQLLQDTLNSYYQDAENLCHAVKPESPLDHSSVQILLPVLKYIYIVKSEFDALLKMVNVDTRKKFFNVVALFEDAVSNALHDFIEKLKETDKHVVMPKDGTVHQITSNATVFLDELVQYLETTAIVLSRTDSHQQKHSLDETEAQKVVSTFVSQVLSVLSLNLTNKSKNYDTSSLQSIFMLNNYNYIIKGLHKIGVMSMLEEHGQPNLEKDYDEAIEEEMNNYGRSWGRVIQHLGIDATDKYLETAGKTHLKEKYKQAIKDKFKGFNTDFDDICQIHNQFTVPDNSLKKRIYERVCDLVVTRYADFLKRYRDVHFTKNVEKYVKYDVDKVRSMIAKIYDIQPK